MIRKAEGVSNQKKVAIKYDDHSLILLFPGIIIAAK